MFLLLSRSKKFKNYGFLQRHGSSSKLTAALCGFCLIYMHGQTIIKGLSKKSLKSGCLRHGISKYCMDVEFLLFFFTCQQQSWTPKLLLPYSYVSLSRKTIKTNREVSGLLNYSAYFQSFSRYFYHMLNY